MLENKLVRKLIIGQIVVFFLILCFSIADKVSGVWDWVQSILSPFIVGGVIAFILNVPMRRIEGWLKGIKNFGVRRTLAIVLTFIFIFLILAIVFVLLIPALYSTIKYDLIPGLEKFFEQDFSQYMDSFFKKYPELERSLKTYLDGEFNWETLLPNAISFLGSSLGTFWSGITSIFSFLSSFLMDVFVTIVFSVYCLTQKEVLARQGRKLLYSCLKERHADYIVRVLQLSNNTFSNFLSGQCIEVVILGSMFAISMAVFGMDYIPVISVLVAVTAFVPIVGAWIGCIIGAFLLLISDPSQAFWFVVLFLVLQQIENHLIYPKVVGSSIGLSGMWVLIAIAVGGALFGISGMFLMIPMTSVIYTLISESTNQRLKKKQIPAEKLCVQPPDTKSKFWDRMKSKKKAAEEKNDET